MIATDYNHIELLPIFLITGSCSISCESFYSELQFIVLSLGSRSSSIVCLNIDLLLIRPATVSRLSAYKSLDRELQFMVPAPGSRSITSD